MSRENVEIVRRIYEAAARRDKATVLALYHPEVEVDSSRLPEARLAGEEHIQGHAAIQRSFRDWYEAWESFEDECERLIDADDRVISVVTRRGRGRTSGAETTVPRAGVWTIREGKVVRVVWFPSVEEALEAAGLSE
jgi:ketosteroid isomerase-like protein